MRDGRILACQRKRTVRYGLKWEFPGGKIEDGETPHDALVRELQEELDIHAEVDGELLTHEWTYAEGGEGSGEPGAFRVTYFLVHTYRGEIATQTFEQIRWVTPEELQQMDVLEGNREAIALLLKRKQADESC
jgi:8-oxo-dGTP diphosphatase